MRLLARVLIELLTVTHYLDTAEGKPLRWSVVHETTNLVPPVLVGVDMTHQVESQLSEGFYAK